MQYFWNRFEEFGDAPALVNGESGETLAYRRLARLVREGAGKLADRRKQLAFLIDPDSVSGILTLYSLLVAGHAVYPVDSSTEAASIERLMSCYEPEIVLFSAAHPIAPPAGYAPVAGLFAHSALRRIVDTAAVHESLALLLSTSGSTGSPKLVRLSPHNLHINATRIGRVNGILPRDCAITNLPVSFAYGLEVLNSHLCAGARVVIQAGSVLDPKFWVSATRYGVNSFSGVPFSYEMLRQIEPGKLKLPALRTITQSGSAMTASLTHWVNDTFGALGAEIYYMYGSSEGGRMAVLPPERVGGKMGSVGFAVPEGSLELDGDGQVIFRGPSVMLGYSHRREDLARGDDQRGVLKTGDVGQFDADACLYLRGRMARFCKILGSRISLDEVEAYLRDVVPCAAIGDDRLITLAVESELTPALAGRVSQVAQSLNLPPEVLRLRSIPAIPRLGNGKISYQSLAHLIS